MWWTRSYSEELTTKSICITAGNRCCSFLNIQKSFLSIDEYIPFFFLSKLGLAVISVLI